MKRTTIRVRKNGTKRAGIAQASTKPSAASHGPWTREKLKHHSVPVGLIKWLAPPPAPPPTSAAPQDAVTLEFCTGQRGKVIAQAEITGEQLRRLEAAAKVAGQRVAKFVENGIGDKLRQLEVAAVESVTLILTMPNGGEWTRVELPEPLYARLLEAARASGMGVMAFIEQAVGEKICRGAGREPVENGARKSLGFPAEFKRAVMGLEDCLTVLKSGVGAAGFLASLLGEGMAAADAEKGWPGYDHLMVGEQMTFESQSADLACWVAVELTERFLAMEQAAAPFFAWWRSGEALPPGAQDGLTDAAGAMDKAVSAMAGLLKLSARVGARHGFDCSETVKVAVGRLAAEWQATRDAVAQTAACTQAVVPAAA